MYNGIFMHSTRNSSRMPKKCVNTCFGFLLATLHDLNKANDLFFGHTYNYLMSSSFMKQELSFVTLKCHIPSTVLLHRLLTLEISVIPLTTRTLSMNCMIRLNRLSWWYVTSPGPWVHTHVNGTARHVVITEYSYMFLPLPAAVLSTDVTYRGICMLYIVYCVVNVQLNNFQCAD